MDEKTFSMDPAGGDFTVSARFPDLQGKTAIVTGGGHGIGAGIARFLARQGMRVVACGRTQEDGESLEASIRGAQGECAWVTADLSLSDPAARVLDTAIQRYHTVDLLVNNAARLRSKSFLSLNEEEYRESFEKNMRIAYHISFLVAHRMAEAGGGVIVNISSVGGLRAHRGLSGYDASKGALDALTRAMALDLAPKRIRVNAVAPGQTRRTQSLVEVPGIPLGRAGTPEDVAAAVAFLASDAGAYITGQVLYVDGGLIAQLTPPGIFL